MLPVHTSFSENFLTTSRLDNFLSDSGGAAALQMLPIQILLCYASRLPGS